MIQAFFVTLGVIVVLVASVADSIADKRSSQVNYPRWHKRFKFFRPKFIWKPLQNRWHVAKQLRFKLPMAYIYLLVVYAASTIHPLAAVLLSAGLPIAAYAAWAIIEPPIWWD